MGPRGVGVLLEGVGVVEHENVGQEGEREQRAVGHRGRGVGQASSPASQEDTLRDVPRGRWTLLQVLILVPLSHVSSRSLLAAIRFLTSHPVR